MEHNENGRKHRQFNLWKYLYFVHAHDIYTYTQHTLTLTHNVKRANNPTTLETTLMNCTFSVCHTHVSWHTYRRKHTRTYIH